MRPAAPHPGRPPGRARPGAGLAAALAWLVALVVLAVSCSAPSTPSVASLIDADAPRGGEPGDVIEAQPIDAPAGARAWRVVYESRSPDGRPIAVTGLVAAPDRPAPPGGWPVLGWAHETRGVADRCAPSLEGTAALPQLGALVDAGWVVAATDYEGLGTTASHPYLVGERAGRSVLDSVRAAQRLDGTGASASSPVALWGFSQGGHAVLFAGEILAGYAPELDLRGVIAHSAVSDVRAFAASLETQPPQVGTLVLMAMSLAQVEPSARLADVLSPTAVATLPRVEQVCIGQVQMSFVGSDPIFTQPLTTTEPWATLLDANRAGTRPIPAPVWVVHGALDHLIPLPAAEDLVTRLCALGTPVLFRVDPTTGHGVEIPPGDLVAWLAERSAGAAPPVGCPAPG